jgi:hypothetical protein
MLRDHVAWAGADAAALAAGLLWTMLPAREPDRAVAENSAGGRPMASRDERAARAEPAADDGHEVMEVAVLFSARQLDALMRACSGCGRSAGGVIRVAVAELLERLARGPGGAP